VSQATEPVADNGVSNESVVNCVDGANVQESWNGVIVQGSKLRRDELNIQSLQEWRVLNGNVARFDMLRWALCVLACAS
jgi:hypothetical protein